MSVTEVLGWRLCEDGKMRLFLPADPGKIAWIEGKSGAWTGFIFGSGCVQPYASKEGRLQFRLEERGLPDFLIGGPDFYEVRETLQRRLE